MSTIVNNPVKQTKVIMMNGRYFSNFGKKGQVQTAWSLAGAKRFNIGRDLNPVIAKLEEKGKTYTIEQIELFERVDCYPPREFFKLRYRLERMMKQSCTYHSFEAYKAFNHDAKFNLVEQVMLTTTQCEIAERNNSEKVVGDVEFFFETNTEKREFAPIAERLELFKLYKAGLESVFFGQFGIEEIPF
ncbi:hypothetical protein [Vibrio mediterranei]|uniref:hypothetical protein n=1 Tax=Vibrio mediterranei TaxID=689 RepID=UPI0022845B51|nr:hypothetical protein [Vibrio mediterranei]MCY9853148.1 hypothetical protein [Vibrio mediterranei]